MFEIGLEDTITISKPPVAVKSVDGNKIYTSPSKPVENQQCRKVTEDSIEIDQTGAQITVQKTKVLLNYTGSAIDESCIAIVNSIQYEIISVKPARGFGRSFIEIEIEARK